MDSILEDFGIDILEEEIDDVLFKTNEFLTASEFIGTYGPFWYILQISMALAAVFAIIVAGQMAYKMMIKNEPLDVLRIFRPFAVALVMLWWYPPNMSSMIPVNSNFCVLDALAMIPNYIGSYTHDLYEAEASNITDQFGQMQELIAKRDTAYARQIALVTTASTGMSNTELAQALSEQNGAEEVTELQAAAFKSFFTSIAGGLNIALDKILIIFSLIIYRIGWWATIYVQQILLGMLTIFGPIQWAFSLLPKWESAWAKWITRYLTVQFYGAMLYFVGFYVLLLFDIVLSIQVENLQAITDSEQSLATFCSSSFQSAAYLMAASIVALRCLNLVPDLAAWMIPEGDTAFSTRNFGEGVAQQARVTAMAAVSKVL